MKAIMLVVIASLMFPYSSFAAPPEGTQPLDLSAPGEQSAALNIAKDGDYSPVAKNIYLGTAIGTMLVGGVSLALGATAHCTPGFLKCVGYEQSKEVAYIAGGSLLAVSTILWILYAREKGKEPASTVGLELDKGRSVITASCRF